jgi:hypothetical protein
VGRGAFYFRYDGMSIGAYLGDAIQRFSGSFQLRSVGNLEGGYGDDALFTSSVLVGDTWSGANPGTPSSFNRIYFNPANVARTDNETRPASISAYVCIKY